MYIPTRTTLFAATLLLLSAACTPQLVKEGETPAGAYGNGDSSKIVTKEQAAAPAEAALQHADSPAAGMSKGEDPPKPLAAAAEKPKPLQASAKPKAKAKPTAKAAAKPKTKTTKPSLAATKKSGTLTAAQKKSDSKTSFAENTEPVQSAGALPDPGIEEKKAVAAQPISKPTAVVLETAGGEPEAAEMPDSMDDDQELAMLTRQEAMSEATRPDVTPVQKLSLDMASLPLTFGAHWTLDRRPNPINHKTQCLLASRSVNISDGYDRTDVQLLLTANSLYVKTESNIDLKYPDIGIHLDDGTLLPFEGLAKETAVMIGGDVAMLYEQMAPSRIALVRLGFWPTWPVTETQEARFSLDGFDAAIKALWLCEKM